MQRRVEDEISGGQQAHVMEEGTLELLWLKSLILKSLQQLLWNFSYSLDSIQEFLKALSLQLACCDLYLYSRWSLIGCVSAHRW